MLNGKKITKIGDHEIVVPEVGDRAVTQLLTDWLNLNKSINHKERQPNDFGQKLKFGAWYINSEHIGVDFGNGPDQTAYSFYVPHWDHLDHDRIFRDMAEHVDKNIMEMFGLTPFEVDGVKVSMSLLVGSKLPTTLSKDIAAKLPWTPFIDEQGIARV